MSRGGGPLAEGGGAAHHGLPLLCPPVSSISFICAAETTAELLEGDLRKARAQASATEALALDPLLARAGSLRQDLQRLLGAVERDLERGQGQR